MEFLHVVWLHNPASEIHFRAYFERAGDFQVLEWFLDRLKRRVFGCILVLCGHESDLEAASRAASPFGISALQTAHASFLGSLAGLSFAFPALPLACYRPEHALAPSETTASVCAAHLAGNHEYTTVTGLPKRAAPHVFAPTLLQSFLPFDDVLQDLEPSVAIGSVTTLRRIRKCAIQWQGGPTSGDVHFRDLRDVYRARASLESLPEQYGADALTNWFADNTPYPLAAVPVCTTEHPKRVLYVSNRSGYTGAEQSLCHTATALTRLGFEQYALIGCDGHFSQQMREAGCKTITPNWDFTEDATTGRELARTVLEGVRPAVLHVSSDPGLALLQVVRETGVPLVTHVRVAHFGEIAQALRQSSRIIAVSDYVRRRLLANGLPDDRIRVIYDGIDATVFRPGIFERAVVRRQFALPHRAFIVLMVARTAPNKRHDVLIEAFHAFSSRAENAILLLVGAGGDADTEHAIRYQIRALQLEQRVRWMPFQPDIRRVEAAANVLVLCSEEEPLGTCVLEAMAMEIPVIVGGAYGTAELVEDGHSGVLVEVGNSEQLAQALAFLYQAPEMRDGLGRAARQRMERHFSLETHAQAIAEVFLDLSVKR